MVIGFIGSVLKVEGGRGRTQMMEGGCMEMQMRIR